MSDHHFSLRNEDVGLSSPTWQQIQLDADLQASKESKDHSHHRLPHHRPYEHGVLPPQYFEIQNTAPAQPPPPYGSFFTSVRPTTRRWLVGLSCAVVALLVGLILVIALVVRPAQQAAAASSTTTATMTMTVSVTPTPTSQQDDTAIATATALQTLVTTVTSTPPSPTTLLKTTTVLDVEPPRMSPNTAKMTHAAADPTKKKLPPTSVSPSPTPSPSAAQSSASRAAQTPPNFLFPGAVGGA